MDHLLLESEEKFRLLVEGVRDYAIFMLDSEGFVVSWNLGAERIKGYRMDEILGQHFSRFYPPEALARNWPRHALGVAEREGRFEEEGWRMRKDGSTFWANVIITALYDRQGLLRGFGKVTRDLTSRKKVEALEEAVTRRNEFLAMLAHELRNPLAPIRNALGVLQTSPPTAEVVEWSRTVIERQVSHLTRLVDDLLDMTRITSNKIKLQKERVEVAWIISGAVESSRPLIQERGHTLEIHLPDEPLWVEGDLTRLSQVLLNLLNNSAKYTPQGGRITVTAEKQNDEVVLRVRDTGVGIPADLLPKVFDLFMQGDRSLDRSEGGLGIGLTLVRQLVHLHGGAVKASSDGAGRGAELTVWLPLAAGPAAGPLAAEVGSPGSSSRRVLIVDDNRDAMESLEILLQLWGHDVRSASDGPAALALAAEFQPEVVLLDIGLPGMTGLEVARQLRALPGLDKAMLAAVTGYGQESDRQQSRDAGFDYHLVKPVELARLRELIAE